MKNTWHEAVKGSKAKALYRGLKTKLVQNKKYCYLTSDYCPLCLKPKKDFEYHHCIWSSDGGTDDSSNLLKLCNTCHAILTRGCTDERVPKDLAAHHHQMIYFGLNFIPRNPVEKGRHRGRSYLENHPEIYNVLQEFDLMPKQKQKRWNQHWKSISRIAYQYYRDIELERWSWENHINQKITVVPWDYVEDVWRI